MHRVLFFDGHPYAIYSYGVMLTLAVIAGVSLLVRRGHARGLSTDTMLDYAMAVLIGGLVGARLVSVWEEWSLYASHPLQILNVRGGGLSWHGSILGGLVGIAWFVRRSGIRPALLLDALTPCLVVGHAIGRLGCFLNGCCYGRPTTLPWALTFPDAPELGGVPRHPTQLYEFFGELIILGILILWERKGRRPGTLFYVYLVLYAVLRFVVEFYRQEPLLGGGLDLAQYASFAILIVGFVGIFKAPSNSTGDSRGPVPRNDAKTPAALPSNA